MHRFVGPASHRCDWPSVLQCFGTTAERQGWNRPKNLPFVEPTSSWSPGPGSYGIAKSSFKTQLQKRLTDDPIAFGSTGVRPCLKTGAPMTGTHIRGSPLKGPNPGPGDYDLNSQSIINMIKRKTTGRHGIFGTCTTRFDPHCLPPEIARLLQYQGINSTGPVETPGPGAYESTARTTHDDSAAIQGKPKNKTQTVYTFRSSVERFGAQEYDVRAPDVLQIGSRQKPSVGEVPARQPNKSRGKSRSDLNRR